MSIFVDHETKLVVQGITGRDGSFHARQMLEYGTQVVAGVTPGKGGQRFDERVPIFNTVADAVVETGADESSAPDGWDTIETRDYGAAMLKPDFDGDR